MYCVGLTGNIASGKSTVAHYFKNLGIEIISADAISRNLTASTQPAFAQIIAHFGINLLTNSGELNRQALSDLIFNDECARLWLEALLHPLIRTEIILSIAKLKSSYCIIEIPLLKARTNYPYLNRILLVQSLPQLQLERLMKRAKLNQKKALAMIALQQALYTRENLADDTICNDTTLVELQLHICKLDAQYKKLSA